MQTISDFHTLLTHTEPAQTQMNLSTDTNDNNELEPNVNNQKNRPIPRSKNQNKLRNGYKHNKQRNIHSNIHVKHNNNKRIQNNTKNDKNTRNRSQSNNQNHKINHKINHKMNHTSHSHFHPKAILPTSFAELQTQNQPIPTIASNSSHSSNSSNSNKNSHESKEQMSDHNNDKKGIRFHVHIQEDDDNNSNSSRNSTHSSDHDRDDVSSPYSDDDDNSDDDDSDSERDGEFGPCGPLLVLALDLDKTLVRTISLHSQSQPQPEQHENGYFMFFDEDTREYHHVYLRPHLRSFLDFLRNEIVNPSIFKSVMLCTHGTEKYAQTILKKCKCDSLFDRMLPRAYWNRRKFDDDYKPRRFKTIARMASNVGVKGEDVLMIDDDPGVYNKQDRCCGNLIHILPFDDPYQQRKDTELKKLTFLLRCIVKYGKNYYNRIFANSIRYTGLIGSNKEMTTDLMAKHSRQRALVLEKLMMETKDYSHNLMRINHEERLGAMFLFDRFISNILDSNMNYLVTVMFACLFLIRQYLYSDDKRPKQFRRDPYSAVIWQQHIQIYYDIVTKYHAHNHHRLTHSKHLHGHVHSSHHSRHKKRYKKREKEVFFIELHSLCKTICEGIPYPKLLHGLYHRPNKGYDCSLFIKYDDYVESLFAHVMHKIDCNMIGNKKQKNNNNDDNDKNKSEKYD